MYVIKCYRTGGQWGDKFVGLFRDRFGIVFFDKATDANAKCADLNKQTLTETVYYTVSDACNEVANDPQILKQWGV